MKRLMLAVCLGLGMILCVSVPVVSADTRGGHRTIPGAVPGTIPGGNPGAIPGTAVPTRPSDPAAERVPQPATPGLRAPNTQCAYPGQLVVLPLQLHGQSSSSQWFIQADGEFVALQPVSQDDSQGRFLLPADSRIKPQQIYRVFRQIDPWSQPHPIAVDIHTCTFIPLAPPQRASGHTPGEIVMLMDTAYLEQVLIEVESLGYSPVAQHSLERLKHSLLVIRTDTRPLDEAIEQLRMRFSFAEVDRNDHYQGSAAPRKYARELINWAPQQDCQAPGAKPLRIGMIDGDIALDHPSLVGQSLNLRAFHRNQSGPDQDHATAIAVLLIGNNQSEALNGLLPDAELIAASVLEQFDDGSVATTEAMARALDWLLAQQVRLVNISLSGSRTNSVLNKILDLGTSQGLLIFAAAGNDKLQGDPAFPAAHPAVFAITAIDAANRVYSFANQGDYLDFSAPGVDIWTASQGKSGQYRSGTSFAAPYAVAVAAMYLRLNPNISRAILHNAMRGYSQDLGAPGHDPVFGWGLIRLPDNLCQG